MVVTLQANNELRVFGRDGSFWIGLVRGMETRYVSLGAVSWATVWKQTWSLFKCFAIRMCGIGRKRCSSRPSHDTWA